MLFFDEQSLTAARFLVVRNNMYAPTSISGMYQKYAEATAQCIKLSQENPGSTYYIAEAFERYEAKEPKPPEVERYRTTNKGVWAYQPMGHD